MAFDDRRHPYVRMRRTGNWCGDRGFWIESNNSVYRVHELPDLLLQQKTPEQQSACYEYLSAIAADLFDYGFSRHAGNIEAIFTENDLAFKDELRIFHFYVETYAHLLRSNVEQRVLRQGTLNQRCQFTGAISSDGQNELAGYSRFLFTPAQECKAGVHLLSFLQASEDDVVDMTHGALYALDGWPSCFLRNADTLKEQLMQFYLSVRWGRYTANEDLHPLYI